MDPRVVPFRMDVQQNQHLILAVGLGLAACLAIALAYLAMWRRRTVEDRGPAASPGRRSLTGFPEAVGAGPAEPFEPLEPLEPRGLLEWLRFIPAVLVLTYLGIGLYALIYTIRVIVAPPRW